MYVYPVIWYRQLVCTILYYNANDPGLMIECLNGYRLKEKLPSNLLDYTVPLGIPEIVKEGDDITIVTYGSTLRIVQEAADIAGKGRHQLRNC